jgi:hypothetical protein
VVAFHTNRLVDNLEFVKTIEPADVQKAFNVMLTDRKPINEDHAPGGNSRMWRTSSKFTGHVC